MKFISYIFLFAISLVSEEYTYAQTANAIFDLQLKTSDNSIYNFNSLKNSKATVYVFMLTDCPASQNYTLTINNLQKKYKSKNIAFNIVFPDTYSTLTEILSFKNNYKITMPILLDPDLKLTKLLLAKVAPQCFVLDQNGNKIYEGRIDDWYYSTGKKRSIIRSNDLDNALNNYLSGKPIDPVKTTPIGCIINY